MMGKGYAMLSETAHRQAGLLRDLLTPGAHGVIAHICSLAEPFS